MVGPDEEERLFAKIVQSRIRQSPSGLVEYPLDAMREYCKAVGDDNRRFGFYLASEMRYEDDYQFCLGLDCDKKAVVSVEKVYYYDENRHLLEPLECGNVMLSSLISSFREGAVDLANEAIIDKDGYLYLRGRCSDDIVADFRIKFSDGNLGYSLYELDGELTYRFWRNKDMFFCAPTKVFFLQPDDLL